MAHPLNPGMMSAVLYDKNLHLDLSVTVQIDRVDNASAKKRIDDSSILVLYNI